MKQGRPWVKPPKVLHVVELGPEGPVTFKPVKYVFDKDEQLWFSGPQSYGNGVQFCIDAPGISEEENGNVIFATPNREEAVTWISGARHLSNMLAILAASGGITKAIQALKHMRRGRYAD